VNGVGRLGPGAIAGSDWVVLWTPRPAVPGAQGHRDVHTVFAAEDRCLSPSVVIVAEGSPEDLGRQHGRAAKDLIHSVFAQRMERAQSGTCERHVLERTMEYVPFIELYAPDLLEEFYGLAEGCDLTFQQALFLRVATELDGSGPEGCS